MAPLIVEQASAARAEAQRVRGNSVALRLTVDASTRVAHVRRAKAVDAAARGQHLLNRPVGSPWSGLHWRRDDEALHTVLVALH